MATNIILTKLPSRGQYISVYHIFLSENKVQYLNHVTFEVLDTLYEVISTYMVFVVCFILHKEAEDIDL